MASIVSESRQAYATLATLLAAVRDIPPDRIRLQPMPGAATEGDVLDVQSREGVLCELIDGILVEKTVGSYESLLAGYILTAFNVYLESHDLGKALGEAGMLRIAADQIRIPDVAFISWQQMPNHELPDEPVWGLHPDLAVEVLSRSNSAAEMQIKVREYFDCGAKILWLIDPFSQSAAVYHAPDQFVVLQRDGGHLCGESLLPGLSISLDKLFRDRARPRP